MVLKSYTKVLEELGVTKLRDTFESVILNVDLSLMKLAKESNPTHFMKNYTEES